MKSKTITTKLRLRLLLGLLLLLNLPDVGYSQISSIQTPNPPYNGGTVITNSRNYVTFVIENTNNVPYRLSEISTYVRLTDNNLKYRLYYNPNTLSGNDILTNFILIDSSAVNTVLSEGYDILPFNGPNFLNFEIPANTSYRFALGIPAANAGQAGTNGNMNKVDLASPNFYAHNGIILKLGNYQINGFNVGNMASSTSVPPNFNNFNPVFWCGGVKMTAAPVCAAAPLPGTAIVSSSSVCPSANITLSLSGYSTGSSITYTWQSAPAVGGPYSNLSPVLYSAQYSFTANNPGTTKYYRCVSICSAFPESISSLASVTTSSLFPAGTYTINAAGPAVLPNFQSFSAAASALACGISGPVVFNVAPGSGPYIEQMTIAALVNTSSVNTITFNGNGNTIQIPVPIPDLANRAAIRLNGADWIRLNDLTINCNTTTNGWGVYLTNNADNNIINNLIIESSFTSTSTQINFLPIAIASPIIATSNFFPSGNAGSNNLVQNCSIRGGLSGITVVGPASPSLENNQFINNEIFDFHQSGITVQSPSNNTIIRGNNVHRTTRPAASLTFSFTGITVNGNFCFNTVIEKNRIHDPFFLNKQASLVFTAINLPNGTFGPGQECKVNNNLIYNVNSLSSQSGITYSGGAMLVYHNTIVLDDPQPWSVSLTANTYGINIATIPGGGGITELKNNLIYISREGCPVLGCGGGSTGAKKACIFMNSITGVVSNNNLLYTSSHTLGINAIGAWGNPQVYYSTLASWQAANSGAWDQQSLSELPVFTNLGTADYTPLGTAPTSAIYNNKGSVVGVPNDITGAVRNPFTPDPGAYEFSVPGTDASITWVAPVMPTSPNPNTVVQVKVFNVGTTTINSLDLTYTANAATSAPQTFSGLNLLPGASVVLQFSATFNFSVSTPLSATIVTTDDNMANNTTAVFSLCPALTGAYIIDKTNGPGTNYLSYTAALAALNCGGVSGPVTFNVASSSGTYNEQLEIFPVTGASGTNTITFDGNGSVLGDMAIINNNQRSVVKLNGADFFRFREIVIDADSIPTQIIISGQLSPPSYGWGFWFTNAADNNRIDACTFNLAKNTTGDAINTGAYYAGVVLSSAPNGTSGASNNGNNNIIADNIFNGGYYGISLWGPNTLPYSTGNQILRNTLNDSYNNAIQAQNFDNLTISGNTIQRPTRTVSTGVFNGILLSGNGMNSLIEKNTIKDLHKNMNVNSTGAIGIAITNTVAYTPGTEPRIINNLISFQYGAGDQVGIRLQSFAAAKIYHNTISIESNAAAATVAFATTRGIDFGTGTGLTHLGTNVDIRNNLITITRNYTSTSTVKACLYFGTTFFGGICDYNDLYITGIGTHATYMLGFYFTAQTSLAGWQFNSNFAFDVNSLTLDPFYQNMVAGNYIPTYALVNNLGTNLGVTTDIVGAARSTTPDMGAYEFDTPPIDIGAVALVSPNAIGCYSNTQQVVVKIKNWGSATLNFAANPATVTCGITGTLTTTLTQIINSGTLAPNMTMDVIMSPSIDMSVYGPYNLTLSATCSGDAIAANNGIPVISRTSGFNVGVITSLPPNVCSSSSAVLTLNGTVGGDIQWQSSLSSSGPWAPVGTNSPTYSQTVTQPTYFQATVSCFANVQTASPILVDVFNTPSVTSTLEGSRCGTGSVQLQATIAAPNVIKWYDAAGFMVGSGSPFNTPSITGTSTFYAAGTSPGLTSNSVGKPNIISPTAGQSSEPNYLIFDAYTDFVLNSVQVVPTSSAANPGAGTITLALQDSAGLTLFTSTHNVTANTNVNNVQTITLNYNVVAGPSRRLVLTGVTGAVLGLRLESGSGQFNTGQIAYPYTVPNVVSIKEAYSVINQVQSTNGYFYFYNWVVSSSCENLTRVPVIATVIPAPTDVINSTEDIMCLGESATISGSLAANPNKTYSWSSSPAGFSGSGQGPFVVTPAVTTTYIYTVTDLATNCASNATRTVQLYPTPQVSYTTDLSNFYCEGQHINFNATHVGYGPNAFAYNWSGPGFSATIEDPIIFFSQISNSGNYTVTFTDGNACSVSQTQYVEVNPNPVVNVTTTAGTCYNYNDGTATFDITVQPNYNDYSILEGSNVGSLNPQIFTGYGDGTYSYQVTELNTGCTSFGSFGISTEANLPPTISCPGNMTVSNDPGMCGAYVNYPTPVGSDNCPNGLNTVHLAGPVSGGWFPIGTTVVSYKTTDELGLVADCIFSVTVEDNEAPAYVGASTCPASFTSCNPVSWTAPLFQDNCPGLQLTSNHAPGVNFPIGVTPVTYTATDLKGNVTTCSFNVTVLDSSLKASGITSNRDFNNICAGGDITLTVNGGHLGESAPGVPAQWKWYTGGCGTSGGGVLVGTGTSLTATPATTTTYYVRAEGGCRTTDCVQITVLVSNVPPSGAPVFTTIPVQGAPGITDVLSVAPVSGATYYQWFTTNGHINSVLFNGNTGPWNTNGPTVNVTFVLPEQNYQLRVIAGNGCGRTSQSNTHIRGTVPAPTSMSGPIQACPATTVTYSITAIPSNSPVSYNWALVPTTAGTITMAANGLSATVVFNAGFGSAQVCVNGISSFGLAGPSYCKTVTSSAPVPGAISGNSAPCSGNPVPEVYSITAVQSAISYSWTCSVPGAIVVQAGNGLSASISFPGTTFTGTVQVTASSPCGTSAPSTLNITNGVPGNPGDISGANGGLCGAQDVAFSLSTSNAVSYLWTVTPGMSIDGGNNLNAVTIDFNPGFSSGTVTVEATYACGSVIKTHPVSGTPSAPALAPAALCANSFQTYFVTNLEPSTDYTWTTVGDITDQYCSVGSFSNCAGYYIETGPAGGSFTVTATNACGTASTTSDPCRVMAETIDMKLYPNPTSGLVTVELYSKMGGMYKVSITDLSGRQVMSQEFKASSGRNQQEVDLGFVNAGLYMVYIKDANGNIGVQKLSVE